jgi:RHH-type proline utilization regulon transcriptional repressor/proline dehydrogenase/delta 1-pyrroline-5-carboxylate dehydrogenase
LSDEIVPAAAAPRIDAVLTDREGAALLELLAAVAARPGPIAGVFRYSAEAFRRGDPPPLDFLVRERSLCINTTAAGGNATLMTIG